MGQGHSGTWDSQGRGTHRDMRHCPVSPARSELVAPGCPHPEEGTECSGPRCTQGREQGVAPGGTNGGQGQGGRDHGDRDKQVTRTMGMETMDRDKWDRDGVVPYPWPVSDRTPQTWPSRRCGTGGSGAPSCPRSVGSGQGGPG